MGEEGEGPWTTEDIGGSVLRDLLVSPESNMTLANLTYLYIIFAKVNLPRISFSHIKKIITFFIFYTEMNFL